MILRFPTTASFPSPQGGSETGKKVAGSLCSFVFPSPQGGSETHAFAGFSRDGGVFPSPQGGSETNTHQKLSATLSVFPSPQGGSETSEVKITALHVAVVSIPSRRVGDQDEMRGKAGKRGQKGGRVAVDLR